MTQRWAEGIIPRNFAWVIRDALAVSERPGGYSRNHRRVRRQEEIVWLKVNGFTRVVSLLGSPHNLHAYDEMDLAWSHFPFGPCTDPMDVLSRLYGGLESWIGGGERVLAHQEELGDRLMGAVAGYLIWSGKLASCPQAVAGVELLVRRQMGPDGRELVRLATQLVRPGPAPAATGPPGAAPAPVDPPAPVVERGLDGGG
ncbi:MAG: hypothetical protein ACRDY2_11125 [Acidimicrobiales bacterium]